MLFRLIWHMNLPKKLRSAWMAKYPKINYIGNKLKLVDWIISNMPVKKGTVVDLFCGGSSVSYGLKKLGFKVIACTNIFFCKMSAICQRFYQKINLTNIVTGCYCRVKFWIFIDNSWKQFSLLLSIWLF